ncbi:MAG: WD_0033/WD_0034 family tandem repeat-containing protein [Wolbachia sp.]|nr:putative uncharacterized protein [Wolbachia endosymbiont of Cimex lectularius]
MPNNTSLTDTQQKLYEKLEAEIKVDQDQFLNSFKEVSDNDLIAFLTAVNTFEKFEDVNQERTETLLAFAISYNRYKAVEAILRAAKNLSILEDILTTTNVHSKFPDDEEHTSTPFALAISLSTISFNDHQESIKTILHAVKGEQNILKKVFNTPATIKLQNREEYTETPLTYAMAFQNGQESIKIVLDAAESLGMLKEVFVAIEEDEREKIKGLLKEAGNQDMLKKILQVETRMAVSKAIKIGIAFGVVTGLAVGVGCFATGVALPILAIAGIIVAAASLVGLVAGGITYAVSSKLEETNAQQEQNLLAHKV